jgi:hypothetical protein
MAKSIFRPRKRSNLLETFWAYRKLTSSEKDNMSQQRLTFRNGKLGNGHRPKSKSAYNIEKVKPNI